MAMIGAATAMSTIANSINEAIAIGPLVTARNIPLHEPSVRCSRAVGSKLCVMVVFVSGRQQSSVGYSWIQDRVQEIDDEVDHDVYE